MPAVKRPFADITQATNNGVTANHTCHTAASKRLDPLRFARLTLSRSLHGRNPYASRMSELAIGSLNLTCAPADCKEILHEDSLHMPFAVAAAHTCSLAAVADEPGTVRVFDHSAEVSSAKDGISSSSSVSLETKPLFTVPVHENAIFDLAWSPDDKYIATASGDQTIRLLDVQTQTVVASLHGHVSTVKQVRFDPSVGNGTRLFSGGRDGRICLWDTRIPSRRQQSINAFASHQPVQALHAAHGHTESLKQAGLARRALTAAVSITSLAILPSGNLVSAAAARSSLLTWDPRLFPAWSATSGAATAHLTQSARTKMLSKALLGKTADPIGTGRQMRAYGVSALTVTDDGATIYALGRDSKINAYAASHPSAAPLHTWHVPDLRVETFYCKMDVSKQGFLACGNASGAPVLIDTRHRPPPPLPIEVADQQDKRNTALCRSLSGLKQLMPLSNVNPVKTEPRFQDRAGVRILQQAHKAECTAVCWSGDGETLMTVGDDCTVRVWRQNT